MKRPFLMRRSSGRLRRIVFSRLYLPQATDKKWRELFVGAPLEFAPGVTVDLLASDFMHAEIAFTGEYEPGLSRRVVELGRKGGAFVDVGANIGYFALLWAASNPRNTALAFEASPRNSQLLGSNVARNGFGERVTVFDFALGRAADTLPFDLGPDGITGWGGLVLDASNNTIEVPVKRLDEITDDSEIDLLKIDVEGADTWVLMGMERLLRDKRIKQIWYEQNKPRLRQIGIQEGEAQLFLRSVGYRAEPMTDPHKDIVDWMALPA